jgi:hypothetical protein
MAYEISDVLRGIVVISFLPPIDSSSDVVRDSRKIQKHIVELLANTEKDVWCIYDFSNIDVQFDDMIMMFVDQSRRKFGSICDQRVQLVGIIQDKTLAITLNVFLEHYGWEMPLFERFEDAVDYIQQQTDVELMLAAMHLA